MANRNLLTPHRLFPCSYQPTLILIAKLGVGPLAAAWANAVTLTRATDARGACLLRGAALCLPRVLPVRLLGSPTLLVGLSGFPSAPTNRQNSAQPPEPGSSFPCAQPCSWQGLDEVTFKGPSNPNYSMIPAPHTSLCSCLCSHGYNSPTSRPNQLLASFWTQD